jgi:hypothetical protein
MTPKNRPSVASMPPYSTISFHEEEKPARSWNRFIIRAPSRNSRFQNVENMKNGTQKTGRGKETAERGRRRENGKQFRISNFELHSGFGLRHSAISDRHFSSMSAVSSPLTNPHRQVFTPKNLDSPE